MVYFYGPLRYAVVLWLHCLLLHGFIQKSDFDIAMGQNFCDVVMKHDYRLCVEYIHVVFFLLNDAYSQWRSKHYKSGGGHLLLGFWK